MRIMISADMEGLSGLDDPRQVHDIFPEAYALPCGDKRSWSIKTGAST